MIKKYEYTFVRLKISLLGKEPDYKKVVLEHAKEGWRLVQVFAPTSTREASRYFYELIFEREAVG
jgi:hypothetical protein